jgi:hypothetical protein
MHSVFLKRLQVLQVIEPTDEEQLGRCAIEPDDHDAAARAIGRPGRSLGRDFIGRLTGEKSFQHGGVSRLRLADAAPMGTQRKTAQMTSEQASAAARALSFIIHRKLRAATDQEIEFVEGNLPNPFPDVRSEDEK